MPEPSHLANWHERKLVIKSQLLGAEGLYWNSFPFWVTSIKLMLLQCNNPLSFVNWHKSELMSLLPVFTERSRGLLRWQPTLSNLFIFNRTWAVNVQSVGKHKVWQRKASWDTAPLCFLRGSHRIAYKQLNIGTTVSCWCAAYLS